MIRTYRPSGARNAPSNKTRIETWRSQTWPPSLRSRNAPSNKTRIETRPKLGSLPAPPGLAMHLPIKQGLKRTDSGSPTAPAPPRNAPSNKTRIETKSGSRTGSGQQLAMHLPIKQGLKPVLDRGDVRGDVLAMHLPIKQGLKLAPAHISIRDQSPSQCTFQ